MRYPGNQLIENNATRGSPRCKNIAFRPHNEYWITCQRPQLTVCGKYVFTTSLPFCSVCNYTCNLGPCLAHWKVYQWNLALFAAGSGFRYANASCRFQIYSKVPSCCPRLSYCSCFLKLSVQNYATDMCEPLVLLHDGCVYTEHWLNLDYTFFNLWLEHPLNFGEQAHVHLFTAILLEYNAFLSYNVHFPSILQLFCSLSLPCCLNGVYELQKLFDIQFLTKRAEAGSRASSRRRSGWAHELGVAKRCIAFLL